MPNPVLYIGENIYRSDGLVTFELYRSCQVFTGPASQATLAKYYLIHWILNGQRTGVVDFDVEEI